MADQLEERPSYQCSECGSFDPYIRRYERQDGGQRHRLRCKACGYRWTVYLDAEGNTFARDAQARAREQAINAVLTDDDVRMIRASSISNVQLAKELGVGLETVRKARNRLSYPLVV